MDFIRRSVRKRGVINTAVYILGSVLYYLFRIVYNQILKCLSINEDYILFYTTPDFYDNAKVFYGYLLKNYDVNKKYIWLLNDKTKNKNLDKTKFIKFTSKVHTGPSLKALYYLAKSKYVFYTHVSPLGGKKNKANQIIINLWHGCGYKNDVNTNKTYFEKNYFDFVLVPGTTFIETKSKFFGCEKNKILPIGYPRYDVLLTDDKYTKEFVHKLKNKNKLIVWMPTFRKTIDGIFPEEKENKDYDIPLLKNDEDLKTLNTLCKKNNILLYIKRHPFQVKYSGEKFNLSNIIFIDNKYLLDKKIQLYSFLRYSDALITDYSSIAIDYLLLNKPIGFLLSDFNKYSNSRGFVFDKPLEYMPGYHIYNIREFYEMLIEISNDIDKYKNKRESIINLIHNKCENYCLRIKEQIFNNEQ